MVKVSLVSYLNSTPYKWGLQNYSEPLDIELSFDFPAACAEKLISNQVDIGLIPIAVFPQIKGAKIISPFGIGANGKVDSVLLVSNNPIDQIEKVTLDYQSKSSIALTKVLFKHYWKKKVDFFDASNNYLDSLGNNEAQVVIGDRALELSKNYKYKWDLPDVWKEFTGLPFVFAAWVANKEIDNQFINSFNSALTYGIENLNQILPIIEKSYPSINVSDYLKNKIKYQISGNDYQQSIVLFLDYIKEI